MLGGTEGVIQVDEMLAVLQGLPLVYTSLEDVYDDDLHGKGFIVPGHLCNTATHTALLITLWSVV
jgi:hypothetical protein